MTHTNKLIPELRFPEFVNEGEWEKKKLGVIGEPLMCKRILKEQTTSNPINGIPFYKIGTFGKQADAFIPVDLFEDFKNKSSFPKKGDILISAAGTIGRLVVYDGLPAYFQDSNIVWLGNDESNVLNSFLFYCYSTIKWQTSDGGIISRLYNPDLKNIKISFSKNPKEQQKIASCLSSLDELLAAHSQKLEALERHKKGLMQNLFPQEGERVPKLRFKEFVGDGEWVEKRLGEIGEPLMCKRILKEQTTTNSKNGVPFYKIGTFGKEADAYIPIELFDEFKRKYSFPKKGDILISAAGTIGRLVVYDGSPAFFQDSNIVWLGNDESMILNSFLFHCYARIKWQTSDGGIISRLYNSDLKSMKIYFPKNEKEQQKIASCLTSLDDLITAQAEKIEQLKLHKRGLMQGLFPKIND